MEIKNLIGVYRNFLTPKQISAFLRSFKDKEFVDAEVIVQDGSSQIDKETRLVQHYGLNMNRTMTECHWFNFIRAKMYRCFLNYIEDKNIVVSTSQMQELTLLKYGPGGFYKPHVDHRFNPKNIGTSREISIIIFLNNDYKGGHLHFFDTNHKEVILDVEPEPGKIIMWPSNFLFPHAATKVEEGTRFVLVSWLV